jgi:hypothetical protein
MGSSSGSIGRSSHKFQPTHNVKVCFLFLCIEVRLHFLQDTDIIQYKNVDLD